MMQTDSSQRNNWFSPNQSNVGCGDWTRPQQSAQICLILCQGFVRIFFCFPWNVCQTKMQKMPNHTNTWSHQTVKKPEKIRKNTKPQKRHSQQMMHPAIFRLKQALWAKKVNSDVWRVGGIEFSSLKLVHIYITCFVSTPKDARKGPTQCRRLSTIFLKQLIDDKILHLCHEKKTLLVQEPGFFCLAQNVHVRYIVAVTRVSHHISPDKNGSWALFFILFPKLLSVCCIHFDRSRLLQDRPPSPALVTTNSDGPILPHLTPIINFSVLETPRTPEKKEILGFKNWHRAWTCNVGVWLKKVLDHRSRSQKECEILTFKEHWSGEILTEIWFLFSGNFENLATLLFCSLQVEYLDQSYLSLEAPDKWTWQILFPWLSGQRHLCH